MFLSLDIFVFMAITLRASLGRLGVVLGRCFDLCVVVRGGFEVLLDGVFTVGSDIISSEGLVFLSGGLMSSFSCICNSLV